jgi:hypothetical protein
VDAAGIRHAPEFNQWRSAITKFTGKRFWRVPEEPQLSLDLDLPLHIARVGTSPEQRRKRAEDLLIELARFVGEARADMDFDAIIKNSATQEN